VVLIVHLIFAQVAVWTKNLHRFPGYAKIYLGRIGGRIAGAENIFTLIGALLAYLIVGGGFLNLLLLPFLGDQPILAILLFFSLGAFLVYFGIKPIAKVEIFSFFLFLAVLFGLLHQGHSFWQIENLLNFEKSFLFLPYGIILFALWGAALIPEITELTLKKPSLIRKIIFWSLLLVIFFYLLFIILLTGITGELTTKDAFSALKYFLGSEILALAFFFGFLICFTSFITLGLTLKKVLWYDFKLREKTSWFFASFTPLFLYFLGIKDFIAIISAVGGVMLGIEGILIVLIYLKAKKNRKTEIKEKKVYNLPKILAPVLIAAFLFGIIYEIVSFF
jgi:amino acid transporter